MNVNGQIRGAHIGSQHFGNASAGAVSGNYSDTAKQMSPQPAAKPELQEYLDRLGNVIDRVEALAMQVAERTNGVLRPPSPNADGCCEAACGPSTFYGQQVQNSITRIAGVSARLQDMLDRLEA